MTTPLTLDQPPASPHSGSADTTPATSIQDLLRFLTQTASIPLPRALPLAKPLHAAALTKPTTLATAKLTTITAALTPLPEPDRAKIARQIQNAAKRSLKKRASGDTELTVSPTKKRRSVADPENCTASRDAFPRLPAPSHDEAMMRRTVLVTNRAPLMLAFAVVSLAFTRPAQPEESRLSLGMAVMSQGARARGRELGVFQPADGIAGRESALGMGGRKVSVLGREVAVLRRESAPVFDTPGDDEKGEVGMEKVKEEQQQQEQEPPYWALDPEAVAADAALPIHTAQSAHAYLIKSFASSPPLDTKASSTTTAKMPSTTPKQKLENLTLLLGALHLLFASWAPHLGAKELGQKGWSWYLRVRPEVGEGRSGWGQKGEVVLGEILELRRKMVGETETHVQVKAEGQTT